MHFLRDKLLFGILNRLQKMVEFPIAKGLHVKCRDVSKPYLRSSSVFRCPVDEAHVPWEVPLENYAPPDYTAKSVHGKPWADSEDPSSCKFNADSDGIQRTSHHGNYKLDARNERPLNPFGRTGLRGRGAFGKWGPNHAADAIVSRFVDGKLQFVAIERHDTGELALPGGMLDRGETHLQAAIREFREEVLGNRNIARLDQLWASGHVIYRGYVDDPRNTDNAWAETVAVNFHDADGLMNNVQLEGDDDAKSAQWVAVDTNLRLYASHEYLVYLFAKEHDVDLS